MNIASRLFTLFTSVPADTPDVQQVPVGMADSRGQASAVSKEQGKIQNNNKDGSAHATVPDTVDHCICSMCMYNTFSEQNG